MAYRITGTIDDADDVVQDVFAGLPNALRTYEGRGTFGAWIHRLATRTSLLVLRGSGRRGKWHRRAASEQATTSSPDRITERLVLQEALDLMPEDLRVVFILKEVEGYSHAEIADLVGISAGASGVRLHRARKLLRKRLEGRI